MLSQTKIVSEVENFTKYLRACRLADSSIKTYVGVLTKYLSVMEDEPRRRTAVQLTEYITRYSEGATMGQVRGTFMHYYGGMLGQKDKLQRVPYPKKQHKLPQVLNPRESLRLIGCIANAKHKAIVALLYFAAMRRSEVCALKFKHLSATSIFIEQSKCAADRLVPLSPALKDILKTYFAEYFPAGKCDRESYLFTGQVGGRFTGGQYNGSSVEAIVNKSSQKIIDRKINPHLLRHCRATDWLNNGFDIYEVSKMLGHRNIKTTETYLHLANETLEEKMANADRLMMIKAA